MRSYITWKAVKDWAFIIGCLAIVFALSGCATGGTFNVGYSAHTTPVKAYQYDRAAMRHMLTTGQVRQARGY